MKDVDKSVLERDVEALVGAELARSCRIHGGFNSTHEGFAVLLEEAEEMFTELAIVRSATEAVWACVKRDDIEGLKLITQKGLEAAGRGIIELIQVAAMYKKLLGFVSKPETIDEYEDYNGGMFDPDRMDDDDCEPKEIGPSEWFAGFMAQRLAESQRRERAAVEDLFLSAEEMSEGMGACVVCTHYPEHLRGDNEACDECAAGECLFNWRGPGEDQSR